MNKAWKAPLHTFFHSGIIRLKFSWVFYIYILKNHYFDNKRIRWIGLTFFEKILLLYRTIASNKWINGDKMQRFHRSLTFLSQQFIFQIYRREWEGGRQSLFLSTIFTRSQLFNYYLSCCIWDNYLLLLITVHVIARLLLSEIYKPPLKISCINYLLILRQIFLN